MFAEVTLPPYRTGTSSAPSPQPRPREARPDRVGHRGGVGAARVPAGPDRPDGLVGDDDAGGRRGRAGSRPVEGAAELRVHDRGLARRPRGRRAARRRTGSGAARRRPPGRACGRSSSSVSPESRAPLRVADDDPGREAGQHRRGRSRRCRRRPARGGRSGRRRRRRSPASASRTAARQTNGGQITRVTPGSRVRDAIVRASSPGIGRGGVHLPVGGNHDRAHAAIMPEGRAVSPGRPAPRPCAARPVPRRPDDPPVRAGGLLRSRPADALVVVQGEPLEPVEGALDGGAVEVRGASRSRTATPRASRAGPRRPRGPCGLRRPAGRPPRARRSPRAGGPRPPRSAGGSPTPR